MAVASESDDQDREVDSICEENIAFIQHWDVTREDVNESYLAMLWI